MAEPTKTDFNAVVAALHRVNEVLAGFDDALKPYAIKVLAPLVLPPESRAAASPSVSKDVGSEPEAPRSWTSAAEFFDAVEPESEVDRVTAMTYYAIRVTGQQEISATEINDSLRALGRDINNIGRAVRKAATAKLIMQTGQTRGRKTFSITARGAAAVERVLAGEIE